MPARMLRSLQAKEAAARKELEEAQAAARHEHSHTDHVIEADKVAAEAVRVRVR